MAMSLAGKTAIVTGAGSGINLAFARLLLHQRCNVVLADLALRPEAQELVSNHSSPSRSPARAFFQRTDVREWPQLERMFHIATQHFGGADIVCPGAGVYEPPSSSFWYPPGKPPSLDSPNHSRYALLDINLTHPLRTTQLAISHFLSRRPSSPITSTATSKSSTNHIVHISSIAGQVTPLLAPLYNASKHAVSGFVRTLAPLDPHCGIRVTAVAPGVIDTPLWRDNPEKLRLVDEDRGDQWVSAEEVADVMGGLVMKEEVEVVALRGGRTGDDQEGKKMVKVEGGLILEVGKGRVRKVEQFMDEGPQGAGNTVSNLDVANKEIWDMLSTGRWGS